MGTGVVFGLVGLVASGWIQARNPSGTPSENDSRPHFCDPRFAALFTPRVPQLGRYEVCATDHPLPAVARPAWRVESIPPLDAFGAAGRYDRSAVARLYGGRRATVAHGWVQENGRFESITLISPYPDPTLTRLLPGTLVVRFIICCT